MFFVALVLTFILLQGKECLSEGYGHRARRFASARGFEIRATVNVTAIGECGFHKAYLPQIVWMKDDRLLTDPRFSFTYMKLPKKQDHSVGKDPVLTDEYVSIIKMENLQLEDRGKYICKIINAPESDTDIQRTLTVKVRDPKPKVIEQVFYWNAFFKCEGYGASSTRVKWLKNGTSLSDDPRYRFENRILPFIGKTALATPKDTYGHYFAFVILNVDYEDAGEYSCELTSANVTRRAYYELIVREPALRIDRIKTFNDAFMFCAIFTGDSTAKMEWFKDGQLLPNDTRYEFGVNSTIEKHPRLNINLRPGMRPFERYYLDPNYKDFDPKDFLNYKYVLVIRNTSREDSGNYTCEFSSSTIEGAALKIRHDYHQLIIEEPAPIIIRRKYGFSYVYFNCLVIGDSKTQVKWYKNGQPMLDDPNYDFNDSHFDYSFTNAAEGKNNEIKIHDFHLYIKKIDYSHAGNYICEYSTAAGKKRKFFELVVEG